MPAERSERRYLAWWATILRALTSEQVLTQEEAWAARLIFSDDPGLRPKPRNYAATHVPPTRAAGPVEVHRDALRELAPDQVVAILAHELGHVIDQSRYAQEPAHRRGAPADEEQRADWWAAQLLDVEIRYRRDTLVQTLDKRGQRRPEGLK